MSEESIHPFDGWAQNIASVSGDYVAQPLRDFPSTSCCSVESFAQYVEILLCAKISALEYIRDGKPCRIDLAPSDLSSRRQSRAYVQARKIACYILYHHPRTWGAVSTLWLARRYNRDHSTISYIILGCAKDLAHRPQAQYITALKEVCTQLNAVSGVNFNPVQVRRKGRDLWGQALNPWTDYERRYLIENYKAQGAQGVSKHLGRSPKAVYHMAEKLSLSSEERHA